MNDGRPADPTAIGSKVSGFVSVMAIGGLRIFPRKGGLVPQFYDVEGWGGVVKND